LSGKRLPSSRSFSEGRTFEKTKSLIELGSPFFLKYGAESPALRRRRAKQRGTYRIFGAHSMKARLAEWSVRPPLVLRVRGSNPATRKDFCALFSEGSTFRAVL